MSRVQIAFQDNDESRYIVAAIEQDNTTAVVHYEPAMIRVSRTIYQDPMIFMLAQVK